MPTYEYECPKCGRFEVFHKINDEALKAKPDCSDPACPRSAVRLVSGGTFHLKGDGWYKTDYPKSSGAGVGSSKSTPESDSKTESSSTPSTASEKPSVKKVEKTTKSDSGDS